MNYRLYSIPDNLKLNHISKYPLNSNINIECPLLTSEEITKLCDTLYGNAFNTVKNDNSYYENMLHAIGVTCDTWLDKTVAEYKTCIEILEITTGFSKAVIEKGIEAIILPIKHFTQLPEQLELFITPNNIKLNFISFAGNIPGSGLYSMLYHLLLKIPTIVKMSGGDTVFPVLFFNSLKRNFKLAGDIIAILYWMGGKWICEKELYSHIDRAILYGSDETTSKIAENFSQSLIYGHKVSFGIIDSDRISNDYDKICNKLALDICQFDQQGCLSPHLYYVIGDENAKLKWAKSLYRAMENINYKLPVGVRPISILKEIPQVRTSFLFREDCEIYSSKSSLDFTIVLDDNRDFTLSPTGRVVFIKQVNNFNEIIELINPWKDKLQGVTIASDNNGFDIMSRELYNSGVNWCAIPGMIQMPPFGWLNSGVNEIAWLSSID